MYPHSSNLVGPPNFQNAANQSNNLPPQPSYGDGSNRFMALMASQFNSAPVTLSLPMGYTENHSLTFLSTGNPCLDFFFHVVPNTPSFDIHTRLYNAWSHHPLTTLKLICNLRAVRGTGKSDKEGFYAAALWLHSNHPKTLACNVHSFAHFGYFKDLPEILFRLLEGLDIRETQKAEWLSRKGKKAAPIARFGNKGKFGNRRPFAKNMKKVNRKSKSITPREVRILNEVERSRIEKEKASKLRHNKYMVMAKKLFDRYTRDPDYRFLYERVSDMFAEHLIADLNSLKSNELNKISLAAKWCPSIDSSFDRSTLLCESIARKVFPREKYKEYEGVEEAHYAYRVRDRLRKQVLVPLRKALELPEVYIGANDWGSIPYNRVASVAMKLYKRKFIKHDRDRFVEYLEKVKLGKATIAAGALLPHEIIKSLTDGESDSGEVAELQWKRMVDDVLKKGKLKNCLPVCDVSGSMGGTPMEVCVALGLLVSELNEEPWKGNVITFSERPQMHKIEEGSLLRKIKFIEEMQWDMNTDFQKVFDLILQVAVNGKLSEEEMLKRVIVFSDMEFDQASKNNWETDYQVIQRKYKQEGYGSSVPEIVFWNLRNSNATPVPSKQKGVALVSGFSKNLMTLFLDDADSLSPEAVMEAAISGDEYNKLLVLD